jgi:hypothetical protein
MSSELMRQTADVLEKLAAHLDIEDQQRQETMRSERRQMAQALSEKYAAATGEELPPASIEKLAASDQDLLVIFEKIAERTGHATSSAPDDMGTPSDRRDGDGPATPGRYHNQQEKTAAAEDADQRLIDWCMS